MGSTERRQRERTEMQALIRETAMKLFTSEGIENVSMRRIAEAIEYTPGALYSYYKDKAELLYAIHSEGFDKLHKAQQAVDPTLPPLQRLRKSGEVYVRFGLENPALYDLMFISKTIAETISHSESWDHGMRNYEALRDIVRDCMAAGVLPLNELESASYAMWSLVHGAVALVLRGRCPLIDGRENDLVPYAVDFFMRIIERGAAPAIGR